MTAALGAAKPDQGASRMNPDYEELGRVAKQSYLDAIAYNPLITADALWPKVARAVLEAASRQKSVLRLAQGTLSVFGGEL